MWNCNVVRTLLVTSELTSELRVPVMTQEIALLHERLKQVRVASGKTQRDFAAVLGVGFRSWQGYENGSNKPGSDVLRSISLLGFNINWVLMGEGLMYAADAQPKGSNYVTSDLPIQIQPVVDAVVEVMTSDHAGVKLALTQNALMFQEMVRNAKKVEKLEKRVEELEKTDKPRETDFKTSGASGESQQQEKTHRAGGKQS